MIINILYDAKAIKRLGIATVPCNFFLEGLIRRDNNLFFIVTLFWKPIHNIATPVNPILINHCCIIVIYIFEQKKTANDKIF